MNGQEPVKKTWAEVQETLKIAVNNSAIQLKLLQTQLSFALDQKDVE